MNVWILRLGKESGTAWSNYRPLGQKQKAKWVPNSNVSPQGKAMIAAFQSESWHETKCSPDNLDDALKTQEFLSRKQVTYRHYLITYFTLLL